MAVVPNTLIIDCPLHPGEHWAVMDVWPMPTAGMYECPRGFTESCEHEDRRIESTQVDFWPTPDIDSSYDVDIYVCNLCGVTIDRDEADPALDAADAEVDCQIDYMRGK